MKKKALAAENKAEIEFWDNRPYRLHERLFFKKKKDKWISINLFP